MGVIQLFGFKNIEAYCINRRLQTIYLLLKCLCVRCNILLSFHFSISNNITLIMNTPQSWPFGCMGIIWKRYTMSCRYTLIMIMTLYINFTLPPYQNEFSIVYLEKSEWQSL